MKHFTFFALSFLLLNTVALGATTEFDELLNTFNKNGVTSLKQEKLHQDTNNSDMVHLGEMLFFDKILSGNKDISCAACHFPTKGTSDALPIPIGTGGEGLGPKRKLANGHFIPRNAPAAFNMGFESFHTTMWDGRIARKKDQADNWILSTPEEAINGLTPKSPEICEQITSVAAAQALFPVTSGHEMRGASGQNEIADAKNNLEVWQRLTERLIGTSNGTVGGIEKYRKLFQKAYPEVDNYDEFNFGHAARAIAAYEMSAFVANSSPFDDFLLGDKSVLSRAQYRGAKVFAGKGQCLKCHSGSQMTNFKSYSIGAPQLGPGKADLYGEIFGEDFGLELITDDINDRYKFKTPTLRNVYHTGPWSHSGAYNNLEAFLLHHVDPEKGMKNFLQKPQNYLSQKTAEDFLSLVDLDPDRNQSRIDSQDPIIKEIQLNGREIKDLYEFLKSLSDLTIYNRVKIPKTVPSGLPVKM